MCIVNVYVCLCLCVCEYVCVFLLVCECVSLCVCSRVQDCVRAGYIYVYLAMNSPIHTFLSAECPFPGASLFTLLFILYAYRNMCYVYP